MVPTCLTGSAPSSQLQFHKQDTHEAGGDDERETPWKFRRLVPNLRGVGESADWGAEEEGLKECWGNVKGGPVAENGKEVEHKDVEVGAANNGHGEVDSGDDEGEEVAGNADEEGEDDLAGEAARVDSGRDVGDNRETVENHDELAWAAAASHGEEEVGRSDLSRRAPRGDGQGRQTTCGTKDLEGDNGDEEAKVDAAEEGETRGVGWEECRLGVSEDAEARLTKSLAMPE